MQAEIFLQSFHNIMFLPRDWHLEVNMLQSIFKVFWVDILNPMKKFLGWKRISRDIPGSYFQAARLICYVHNVMSTHLLCCYVSATFVNLTKRMQNHYEANVLCSVAKSYRDWLLDGIKSSDKHLRVCAHFMSMSGNFLKFVQAYRYQDSIIIKSGNSWFAPQWKLLGQLKYLEAYHE
jgi:hypothetical protein